MSGYTTRQRPGTPRPVRRAMSLYQHELALREEEEETEVEEGELEDEEEQTMEETAPGVDGWYVADHDIYNCSDSEDDGGAGTCDA